MRTHLVLAAALTALALSHAHAQCSPATRKLVTDLKFDEARSETQALLRKNGSDDAALHCMGRIYESEGRSSDAVDWYEKAVKAKETNANHHLALGGALGTEAQKASKFRQPFLARRVKTEFERAVTLDPNLIDGHNALMQYYLQAPGFMGGSIEKAKEQAQIIGRLNPLQGHYAMATIAGHEKDAPLAERELQAAVSVAPDSVSGWYALGQFYQNQARWSEAFALYERMMKDKPSELIAHFQYGRTAALSGQNMERGERELRYWLANAPKDAPVVTQSGAHWRLGMIYEKQGKKDVARSAYQTALSINPKNTDARKMLDALK